MLKEVKAGSLTYGNSFDSTQAQRGERIDLFRLLPVQKVGKERAPETRIKPVYQVLRRLGKVLEKTHYIQNINFQTATREIGDNARLKIDQSLATHLSQMGLSAAFSDQIVSQLNVDSAPFIKAGDNIDKVNQIPVADQVALKSLDVTFRRARVEFDSPVSLEMAAPEEMVGELNGKNLSVTNFTIVIAPNSNMVATLEMDITTSVGVVELDDSGRQAILYESAEGILQLHAVESFQQKV